MQYRKKSNVIYYLSVVMIVLFFGCSLVQSHKTLTFFFDGVDKVTYFNDYLSRDSLTKDAINKREALLKRNRPDLCVHKPYKEKKCEQCHTPDKRLLMPMPDLCFKCHQNFNESYSVVHGPVASGSCTNCHNQHSSKYAKLLIRQGQQVCLYCHNSSLIFADKVHKEIEDAECTLCHSPHGGNNKFMVKQHIPRDANRIALMTELTYRHLYGQIFCKVPGDVSAVMEVSVLDGKGAVVATVRPDSAGRFYLSNLHPDQNYSFRFKNDFPDCKINIMDNNGFVLYVVEKGKKGKYIFDKLAYETVHTAINDAHFLGDSVVTPYHRNSNGEIVIPSVSIAETVLQPKATKGADSALNPQQQPKSENIQPVNNKGKIIVNTVPDNISTEELLKANRLKDTIQSPDIADKKTADTVTYKGKMVVKDVPDGVSTKEFLDKNKSEEVVKTPQNTEENKVAPVKPGKGKMLVSDLLDSLSTTAVSQGKLKSAPVGSDILKKYRLAGVTLTDLANQVAKFYDGTVICVLNDSAYCVDITKVNAKGEFLLFDFLSFKMTLPDSGKHIVSQTVFLNERMELVEVVNKRIINGLYAYVLNSKEALENRVYTVIKPNKANAVLFTTIFFEKGNVQIAGDRVAELDKVAAYLVARPLAIVYLAGYPDGRSPGSRSKKFCDDRLKSTIEYLVSKGVKSTRIKQRGNGNTQPLAREGSDPAEDSEKYRRRLEIYIKNR